jgi:general secretion pathway protein E
MGIEPFLIASSLEGVVAQRLVRKICPSCKAEEKLTDIEINQIIRYHPTYLAKYILKTGEFERLKNLAKYSIDEMKKILNKIMKRENISEDIMELYKQDYKQFLQNTNIYKGLGCENCLGTGYKGRIAIYEIMEIDEELRALISKNTETSILKDKAQKNGMKTLIESGIEKVLDGTTTLEEVLQVAQV